MPGDIYPWLLQRGHIEKPLVLYIFSALSVKNSLNTNAMLENCPHNISM